MDFVFRNDNPDFLIQKLTSVEKIGHSFHMQEMWMKAQKTYSKLKTNPPTDVEDFCTCANDVEANGIIKELLMIANTNKNFGNEIPVEILALAKQKGKGFDYGMNYDKNTLEKQQNPPKGFDYGLNYNEEKLRTAETEPKGFDYGMNYDKDNVDNTKPKGFDYNLNYDKEKLQAAETKPKGFDYGMNYDKANMVKSEPKGFDYGMNYNTINNGLSESSKHNPGKQKK